VAASRPLVRGRRCVRIRRKNAHDATSELTAFQKHWFGLEPRLEREAPSTACHTTKEQGCIRVCADDRFIADESCSLIKRLAFYEAFKRFDSRCCREVKKTEFYHVVPVQPNAQAVSKYSRSALEELARIPKDAFAGHWRTILFLVNNTASRRS